MVYIESVHNAAQLNTTMSNEEILLEAFETGARVRMNIASYASFEGVLESLKPHDSYNYRFSMVRGIGGFFHLSMDRVELLGK